MVKCNQKHVFSNTSFNKTHEKSIPDSPPILCSALINKDTQLILVTKDKATIHELPSLKIIETILIQGEATVVKSFESAPGILFFGIKVPTG